MSNAKLRVGETASSFSAQQSHSGLLPTPSARHPVIRHAFSFDTGRVPHSPCQHVRHNTEDGEYRADHDVVFGGGLVPGYDVVMPDETASSSRKEYSPLERWLGVHELRSRAVYGAALTEFNFTMIFMFFHVAIVRAATSGDFDAPPVVGAIGHFLLISL